ncbi:hypothetical protein HYV83_05230 [Candidatus Woesearchaeota archaeon]|nr:hypothetical protein [Candidatus Woesearchaeota archaeon]
MIICDSSSLILLAKINRLSIVNSLYGKILIPKAVYDEVVVKGKEERYSDAFLIEKQIGESIAVKELDKTHTAKAESLKAVIGKGEAEAIALCEQERQKTLLTDDLDSMRIAKEHGIKCRTTLGLLYEALKKGLIRLRDYESSLKEFSKNAWISAEIITEFLQAGQRLKGDKR